MERSYYRGWRAKNLALIDFATDDGTSVNVPLIAGVAVARLIVSLGGSLPMRYQKNETETIFFSPNRWTMAILEL